ncbi:tRNA 4-demethylwyosine synthase (AdoMet-dependent) protein [Dioscorea alata]|uniref:tRNA 4-demethylwyosine synthase (AdoMet-dependent) protein n=1 Tax=Dioscorea alata TaxID=55571 RepID=A0ACB7UCQ4_DIOAL|nr:tRNA 4-demethylwyosine synthase (AdoMet-dependent) protein [Dioscorea alata]
MCKPNNYCYLCTNPAALAALLSFSSLFFFYQSRSLRRLRRLSSSPNRNPKILFASQTGTSEALARRLAALLRSSGFGVDLVHPQQYEPEDLQQETLVLIVASTWEDGKPPGNAAFLARWLSESAEDFRVGSLILSRCRFAVFGVGSGSYGQSFNAAARDFARWMRALGAVEMVPVCEGDVDSGDLDGVFESWSGRVLGLLKGGGGVGKDEKGLDVRAESDGFDELEEDDEDEEVVEPEDVDMEDIAGKAPSRRSSGVLTNGVLKNGENGVKEMVTPVIRTSLEKQMDYVTATRSWRMLQARILWDRESQVVEIEGPW